MLIIVFTNFIGGLPISPASPQPRIGLNGCPKCHAAVIVEVSAPGAAIACPHCGHWLKVRSLPDGLQVFGERSAERTIARFAEHADLAIEKITPGLEFPDVDADSLDLVEITMEIEGDLDITLESEETESVRTVGDVIRAVDFCLSGKKE